VEQVVRRVSSTRLSLLALISLLPSILVWWLLTNPRRNLEIEVPTQHFLVVTAVSAIALAAAGLIAHAARRTQQHHVLYVALGFMAMAGLFGMHGAATPGVFDHSHADIGDYNGSILGLSAFLSLFVPSLFFAASVTSIPDIIERRLRLGSGIVFAIVVGGLVVYAFLAWIHPHLLTSLPISRTPASDSMALVTIGLLLFTVLRHGELYLRRRLPLHGAMVIAALLLAQAQIPMDLAQPWTLAWWVYHALMFAAVSIALISLVLEIDRRLALDRFLPDDVINRALAGELISRAPEIRVATILFADLRDSTSMAETMDVNGMVELLNAFLSTIAQCVIAEGGVVDKFLGDGVMAIFNGDDGADGARAAARAVLRMQRAVAALNVKRSSDSEPTIRFGAGVHTGTVVLATVGLRERSDFTALGDTVNTAARLSGVCKLYGVEAVLSGETVSRLDGNSTQTRPLGTTTVQGKAEAIPIFALDAR